MKTVVFRFSGGAHDGQAIRSDGPEYEQEETETLWM